MVNKNLIGHVCIKTAGKEKNKPCVIVDVLNDNFVVIDGLVKKRRCNLNHLKFTGKIINPKKFEKNLILEEFVKEGIISKEKLEKIRKKEKILSERKKRNKEERKGKEEEKRTEGKSKKK